MPESRPLTGSLRAQIGEVTMTHPHVRLSLRIVAAAFAFSLAGLAQAVIFNSHFDPTEFLGDAQFQFLDSCVSNDPGLYADCDAQFLGAAVDITDDSGTAHVVFTPPLDNTTIFNIRIDNHTLAGVNSDLIGWAFAASGCTGDLCGVPWWIQFNSVDTQQGDIPFVNSVQLFTGSCGDRSLRLDGISTKSVEFPCEPFTDPEATANNVTFTRVPEPATLLLVAGGLFAAWRSRRSARGR
jgi:PEP-CTERM motif